MKRAEIGSVDYIVENSDGLIKPRLLLHACCAPCSAGALWRLEDKFDVTLFFYNPNIMPSAEYERRLDAFKPLLAHFSGVKLIVPEQNAEEFLAKVKGMESLPEGGERCSICFDMRLRKAAEYAAQKQDEFDYFATTLTVGPAKNAKKINEIGAKIAEKLGIKYLSSDFKKKDGYLHSIKLSAELGIYRQHYCGCGFSIVK